MTVFEKIRTHFKPEYFLEHLEELVLGSPNPLKRAAYFGLLFDQTPTYEELLFRTPKLAPYLALKPSLGTSLVPVGEPTGPILEHLFESLIRTDAKLQELGFTYYNGKVVVLEDGEEENGV